MSFTWLKHYMPRSLYGRAALILVLPIVTLQLLVSVVFIQRHFSGVTEQLTRQLVNKAEVLIDMEPGSERDAVSRKLAVEITDVPESNVIATDIRAWNDLSGIVVIQVLHDRINGLESVTLGRDGSVVFFVSRNGNRYELKTQRGAVSASNPHQLLVNMLVFGLLMTLIAFLYLRNQLRPIARLGRAAEAFGRGRVVPYSPGGAVEVRAAGHAFLDMRSRIERHIEQRTMLLSGVSHDLRTPLTRLRLGLEFLDEDDRVPLERDVDDMQRLIDSFLDFARGMAQTDPAEPCDPNVLVGGICDGFSEAKTQVVFVPSDQTAEVKLRKASMQRAIENLISNATRFAARCHVSVILGPKSLCIRIEDDGPGIPVGQREQAMRPFIRLDPSRNQDSGPGVGLGLSIAADIARAHGGVLRLSESETLGGLRADIVFAR